MGNERNCQLFVWDDATPGNIKARERDKMIISLGPPHIV